MQRLVQTVMLLMIGLAVWTAGAHAADAQLGLEMRASYQSRDNYLDRGIFELLSEFHFTRDTSDNLISLYPRMHITGERGVEAYFEGELFLEHHFDDIEEDDSAGTLTSAYISFFNRRVRADIGLQPVQFGKGRLVTDDAPALKLTLDVDKVHLDLTAARVLDQSPAVSLSLGYSPGFLEDVTLFGVWLRDEDDLFAQTMSVIQQILFEPESTADLYWVGTTADLFIGPALLAAVGAVQFGEATFSSGDSQASVDISSFYAELSLDANLSETWSAGIFGLAASGDDNARDGEISAFVSLQSYHPRGAIFFDPDFLDREAGERLTYGASTGGGVLATGLNASFAPTEQWRFDVLAAHYWSHEALDGGEQVYGWEVDLEVNYTFDGITTLFAQAARFWHGDYFEAALNESVDPATLLVVGLKADF